MIKILHITPHLGGGVGTVLLNWLTYDKSNIHSIITLDYANEKGVNLCKENDIPLFSQISTKDILAKIKSSDITLIHFWNHPLLYDFLIRNPLPESRIIIWAHVSGAKPPYVFNKKLLDMCDKFVLTTPASYNYITSNPKLACIFSTGGIDRFKDLKPEPHDGYNVGYIGTVDYAKMHPQYIETLSKTSADKIFIVGGDNEKEICRNLDERFVVTGKLQNIIPVLKQFDVFAYLLNPNHYGTAEQVLQEAMSAGVVPVVLNNPCETQIIKHLETGLVAKNLTKYIDYINLLKQDLNLRKKLSGNAKRYAIENFSLENLSTKWNGIFDEVITMDKSKKSWTSQSKHFTSYDIFMESLGEYSEIFKNKTKSELKYILNQPEWNSKNKGTPFQYYKFLEGEELKNLIDNQQDKTT